jgi:hypothetical protein
MRASNHTASPFDMLVNPQAILDAIEHSASLEALQSTIWRPLERNIVPKVAPAADARAFDATVDRSGDFGTN